MEKEMMEEKLPQSHLVSCPHEECAEQLDLHSVPLHLQLCTAICDGEKQLHEQQHHHHPSDGVSGPGDVAAVGGTQQQLHRGGASPPPRSSSSSVLSSSGSNQAALSCGGPSSPSTRKGGGRSVEFLRGSSRYGSPRNEPHSCAHLEAYDAQILDMFANTLQSADSHATESQTVGLSSSVLKGTGQEPGEENTRSVSKLEAEAAVALGGSRAEAGVATSTEVFPCPHECDELHSGRELALHLESCKPPTECESLAQDSGDGHAHCTHQEWLDQAALRAVRLDVRAGDQACVLRNQRAMENIRRKRRRERQSCPHSECGLEVADDKDLLEHLLTECCASCGWLDQTDGHCKHADAAAAAACVNIESTATETAVADGAVDEKEAKRIRRVLRNRELAKQSRERRKLALVDARDRVGQARGVFESECELSANLRARVAALEASIEHARQHVHNARFALKAALEKQEGVLRHELKVTSDLTPSVPI